MAHKLKEPKRYLILKLKKKTTYVKVKKSSLKE